MVVFWKKLQFHKDCFDDYKIKTDFLILEKDLLKLSEIKGLEKLLSVIVNDKKEKKKPYFRGYQVHLEASLHYVQEENY